MSCCFVAIGVTNQRETTIVWDKETGEPLYNAVGKYVYTLVLEPSVTIYLEKYSRCITNILVWLDLRTQSTVEHLISKTPGRNKNHLKVYSPHC